MKHKFKIASGILALAVGLILGWYASTILGVFFNGIFDIMASKYILMGIFASLFVWWDFKAPTKIEAIGYIFSIFIILQSLFWDFPAGDINEWRITMFFLAIGLLIFNAFTGHLRWKAGVRFLKRTVGYGN